MSEEGDRARKALHDLRWGPYIENIIERQEKMDDAIRMAVGAITILEARLSKMDDDYYELLYAVINKHEGETRHETALRYITEHENRPARETLAGERR